MTMIAGQLFPKLIATMLHLVFLSDIIASWFRTQFEFCKPRGTRRPGHGSWYSRCWKKPKNHFPLTIYRGFCAPGANI